MDLLERLTSPGPKRILALDGGGIRGALTVGYLRQIESILRERTANPGLVLADYFDLIGGTSTGAVIAAALAIGMSAEKVEQIYLEFGGEVFAQRSEGLFPRVGLLRGRYSAEPLRKKLFEYFGERTLDAADIRTGLCIVTKRADTNSTWPIINHPEGRYFPSNRSILLRRAIRASTAAPTYFDPEEIDVGNGVTGAFVDGGVSLHNNPALLLFLVATLKGFPFRWKTGDERLLLVSVGTGYWNDARAFQDIMRAKLWDWGSSVPGMLMDDATWFGQLLLQYLSRSPTAHSVDREVGTLGDDLLGTEAALTYVRYNVALEETALCELGLDDIAPQAVDLREMSRAENRYLLNRVGTCAGQAAVLPEHFPAGFDLSRERVTS